MFGTTTQETGGAAVATYGCPGAMDGIGFTEPVEIVYVGGWEHHADMETMRIFLEKQGLSVSTVDRYIQYANHCLKVLDGTVSPRDDCTLVRDELESRLSDLKSLTRKRYMSAWDMFVRAVNSGRPDPYEQPYHLSEEFDDALVRYRQWMNESGYSGKVSIKASRCVRHCWKIMFPLFGDLRPEDVDEEVVSTLDFEMMGNDYSHRKFNLGSLGRFVHFVTGGQDPYRMLTIPERRKDPCDYVLTWIRGSPFEDALELYAQSLAQRGRRPTTIENKIGYCMSCIRRLTDIGWDGELEDLLPDDIYYMKTLFDDVKESTARTYLSTFGNFIAFLTGNDPVKTAGLSWNGDKTVHRKFIFNEEWFKLKTIARPDEMLILALGAGMGLRRAEIAGLKLDDIEGDHIRIRGKGYGPNGAGAEMTMPMLVRDALEVYLPERQRIIDRYGDNSGGHVLVRGFVYAGEPIPPDTIGDMIYNLGQRAGVDLSSHSLRRLFAMTMLDNGISTEDIRKMMRHNRIDTTLKCYIQADPRRIMNAVKCIDSAL